MTGKLKTVLRVGAFFLLVLMLFLFLNVFFQPYWAWDIYNNYYTYYGFYEEPKNTNEAIFLGPSTGVNGIAPMEMYRDYGICAYNLCSEKQPVAASYYWLLEAHRLHPETLNTVFMEVSGIRRSEDKEAFYHKALDGMRFSSVKFEAVRDLADGSFSKMAEYLCPLYNYHSRWDELSGRDYKKFELDPVNGTRGYGVVMQNYGEGKSAAELPVRATQVSEGAKASELNESNVIYLEKMVRFCEENDLHLVLFRTPSLGNWSSGDHLAIKAFSEEHDVEFMDFNYAPFSDEIGYLGAYDSQDINHMNCYGATKLSRYLGEYLSVEHGLTDVRGNERYVYLEEQLRLYDNTVSLEIDLMGAAGDVCAYLEAAMSRECAVLLSVKDEASESLTDEQRERFRALGLTKLAELGPYDSYCAFIENGRVISEQVLMRGEGTQPQLIIEGVMQNEMPYKVVSGGYYHENKSSIVIGEGEWSKNERGINVAVYSYYEEAVISNEVFDTFAFSETPCYNLALADCRLNPDAQEMFAENPLYQEILLYLDRMEEKNASVASAA